MEVIFVVANLLFIVALITLLAGLIKPGLFTNKKTGKPHTRSHIARYAGFSCVLFLALAIASSSDDEDETKTADTPAITTSTKPRTVEDKPTALTEQPVAPAEQVAGTKSEKTLNETAEIKVPEPPPVPEKAPLTLDEAKSLANNINKQLGEMEELWVAGAQSGDVRGIKRYIINPLDSIGTNWSKNYVSGTRPQAIQVFSSCADAVSGLRRFIIDSMTMEEGVLKAKTIKAEGKAYYKDKEACETLVNETKKQSQARFNKLQDDYKKLIDRLGGEDCFTVFTPDGERPKPAHCKKT